MNVYYRVIKENPLWEVGAILQKKDDQVKGIQDIWNRHEKMTEYLSPEIVENSTEFFERVYSDNVDKMLFVTKEELKKLYETKFIK